MIVTACQGWTGRTRSQSSSSCAARQVTSMTVSSFKYEVFGKVQGVFFRASTAEEAKKLGLVGYVMNTASGSVKGEAQGPKPKIDMLKDFLQHKGSPGSRIDRCDLSDETELDVATYHTFEVRR